MAEDTKFIEAKAVFDGICRALDNQNWKYKKVEEALRIRTGARGEDLPMNLVLEVNADRRQVLVISPLTFEIPEEKRLEVAIAVSAINDVLIDGCFDYDLVSGRLLFRMTNSFADSTLGEAVFTYLLFCTCSMVDEYNDKFLMLAKGMISLDKFISDI